jgi:hypothetical protein
MLFFKEIFYCTFYCQSKLSTLSSLIFIGKYSPMPLQDIVIVFISNPLSENESSKRLKHFNYQPLPTIQYLPSGTYHPVPTIRYLPSGTYHPVPTIRYLSSGAYHPVPTVRHLPSGTYHPVPLIHPYGLQYTEAVHMISIAITSDHVETRKWLN